MAGDKGTVDGLAGELPAIDVHADMRAAVVGELANHS